MSSRWISRLGTSTPTVDLVGGKGMGLATLSLAGLPIPPAFAVSTTAFADAVGDAVQDAEHLLENVDHADLAAMARQCQRARELIFDVTAGHDVLHAVVEGVAPLLGDGRGGVAVRSSGVDEDGRTKSFAGGHDSYLWVRGPERVAECVRRCWASLFNERAVHYRMQFGRPSRAMAVVVQKMVDATAAGVLMTLNPHNGDRSVMVVESVWGLGDALVSGEVTPDRYWISRVTGDLARQTIAAKTQQIVGASVDGTLRAPVPAALVDQPSLERRHLETLRSWIGTAETCMGGAADVEFAVDQERVWCLQGRPETYWSNREARRPAARGSALDAILSTLNPLPRAT